MVDAVTIMYVSRKGYQLYSDDEGLIWYQKGTHVNGPFKNFDEAAYDALADYEMNEAYKFWKTKDESA